MNGNGFKLLLKGTRGALLEYESENKYELISAWGYDEKDGSWGAGHYFTLWKGHITEENKKKLLGEAVDHFRRNYL